MDSNMKIGIDLDNTICSTNEKVQEYEKIFIRDNNINKYILWYDNHYADNFLSKYLEKIYTEVKPKPNAIKTINRFKEQGHEVYIITARTNSYVTNMYNLINNYCMKHNINIDGIFIDAGDKVDICLKNNIDIMIEDSIYNYDRLTTNNINTILFDEYNQYNYIKKRVLSWEKINNVIK